MGRFDISDLVHRGVGRVVGPPSIKEVARLSIRIEFHSAAGPVVCGPVVVLAARFFRYVDVAVASPDAGPPRRRRDPYLLWPGHRARDFETGAPGARARGARRAGYAGGGAVDLALVSYRCFARVLFVA